MMSQPMMCLLFLVLFIGLLFQSSVYLWQRKLKSSAYCACGDESKTRIVAIEPFPQFQLSSSNMDEDAEMLRTHHWWNIWNGDSNCTRHRVHLLKSGSEPQPGAFVSFPGSGNTWTRSLLMGVTGIYVTSVYIDESRFPSQNNNNSYEIPIDCGCSLLQKTHDFSLDGQLIQLPREHLNETLIKFNAKGILLIRNPFKAIQSYLHFKYGGMKGRAPRKAFTGKRWDEFVSRSVVGWETLNSVWIRGMKRGGVIHYERLRHDPRSELLRLVTFLGLNLEEDRLDCVLRHVNDNSFKRRAEMHELIENPYTASQRHLIHKSIEKVQLVLKERGLDPLPVQYYDLYDNMQEYGFPDL